MKVKVRKVKRERKVKVRKARERKVVRIMFTSCVLCNGAIAKLYGAIAKTIPLSPLLSHF